MVAEVKQKGFVVLRCMRVWRRFCFLLIENCDDRNILNRIVSIVMLIEGTQAVVYDCTEKKGDGSLMLATFHRKSTSRLGYEF